MSFYFFKTVDIPKVLWYNYRTYAQPPLAHMDRVPDSDSVGGGFDSRRVDQKDTVGTNVRNRH